MDYDLWLILLPIGNSKKIKLINDYKTAKDVYNNFELILENDSSISKKIKNFKKNYLYDEVMKLEELLYKEEIGYITYANPLYKEKLNGILDKPYFLFYKGNIDVINNKSIGVVGARNCSKYGFAATKLLTKELITNNITLISGGARGVDSIAHKTALENDGLNIAVMGCGIDKVYPAENKILFSKIAEKGVIISEFLPGTKPFGYNFPRRNRIISGLSNGVIVIEASRKSGSLITADFARQQEKGVMVVPGSIFYDGARGSNELLVEKDVTIYTGPESLNLFLGFQDIKITPIKSAPEKDEILNVLSDTPIHIDNILNNTSFDRGVLYAMLFEMQIKNEIICLPGNYYIKTT